MTFWVLPYPMPILCLLNIGIYRKFYQNQLLNRCARDNLAENPKSPNPKITLLFCKM